MKSSAASLSILAALTGVVTGCASPPEEQEGHVSPPPAAVPGGVVENQVGTLVASIDFEGGHVVRFYEIEPGLMIVTESGQIEEHPPLLAGMEVKSYVEVFEALAPDKAIPAALLDAEARHWTARPGPMLSEKPDEALAAKGLGPSFYTTAEQTWFRNTFCPWGTPKCIQGWDWADSGWDYTTNWKSTAFVGSEGAVAASHNAYWWKCSGASCWWEPLLFTSISPGWYNWISSDNGSNFYFRATLTGAGGGTQVSMAISDGPYNCTLCNDGSCHCGYNTPSNFCASHGGVNPNFGCIVQF